MYECPFQEDRPREYASLIWADELSALLKSVRTECEERVAVLVRKVVEAKPSIT